VKTTPSPKAPLLGLLTLLLICGGGCQNLKTVEVGFGGLEVEYFPGPTEVLPPVFVPKYVPRKVLLPRTTK
jgi:hypothetical protein